MSLLFLGVVVLVRVVVFGVVEVVVNRVCVVASPSGMFSLSKSCCFACV